MGHLYHCELLNNQRVYQILIVQYQCYRFTFMIISEFQ